MLNRHQKNYYIQRWLSKYLFWDVFVDRMDYKKNMQDIIERVAVYGNENDERIMNIIYSKRLIKKCLVRSDCLNEQTVKYYSFKLGIKDKAFKWYSKKLVQMSC